MFRLFFGIIFDPAVRDDTYLPRPPVHHLEHVKICVSVSPPPYVCTRFVTHGGIEAKVCLRGSGEDDEEFEERARVAQDVRYLNAIGSMRGVRTSNHSKGVNVKGAARHNSQIRNFVPYTVDPNENTRRGSLRMMRDELFLIDPRSVDLVPPPLFGERWISNEVLINLRRETDRVGNLVVNHGVWVIGGRPLDTEEKYRTKMVRHDARKIPMV